MLPNFGFYLLHLCQFSIPLEYDFESRIRIIEFCETRSVYLNQKKSWLSPFIIWRWGLFLQVQFTRSANYFAIRVI